MELLRRGARSTSILVARSSRERQTWASLLLAAAVLMLVGLHLCLPTSTSWNITPGYRLEPLPGLYPPEQEPDGRPFRWMSNSGALAFPASSAGILLLDVAAPHWQVTTSVSVAFGSTSVSFTLQPGPRRVQLLAPQRSAPGSVLLAADASSPPGDQRLLGLKLYAVRLVALKGWEPSSAALLIATGLVIMLSLCRLRQPLWALPAILPLLLPSPLLIACMPWIAFGISLWAISVVFHLYRPGIVVLSALMFLAYLAASPLTLTTTNDGSHYALIRAMGDAGSLAIDNYVDYTGTRDVAQRAGHYYSDRPPGMALLALPLYLTVRGLASTEAAHPGFTALLIQNAVFGALAVTMLYLVCRSMSRSRNGALFAALAFGLGSIHWKYSSILYAHALGALLSILALWLALRARTWRGTLLAGVVAGYSVAVEYTTALLIPPLLLVLLRHHMPIWWSLGGLALGMMPLLLYNIAAFGHPLHTGYTYHATFDWARHIGDTFVYPVWDGLWHLLFDTGTMIHGLVPLTPVSALLVPGLVLLWFRHRRLALLWAFLVLPTLLLIATHQTFFGGIDRDPRYLAAIMPLLFWPLAWLWDYLGRLKPPHRLAGQLLCGALLVVSMLNQMKHLAYTTRRSEVHITNAHTIWSWHFTWSEFWWAAFPGRTAALYLLLLMAALGALVICARLITPSGR